MSPTQKTSRPAAPANRKGGQPTTRRRLPLVAVLIAVVAVVLLGAIVITSLGDDYSAELPASVTGVAEVQPVTVTGDPLSDFPGIGGVDPWIGATAPVVDG